jgi:hypothetical protein
MDSIEFMPTVLQMPIGIGVPLLQVLRRSAQGLLFQLASVGNRRACRHSRHHCRELCAERHSLSVLSSIDATSVVEQVSKQQPSLQ